jgi:hypothetical protein
MPELHYQRTDRKSQLNAVFFVRSAARPRYENADIRELNWRYRKGSWSLLAGVNRVFWGVAESRHAVDVINQSDMRESFTGDVKMGQPMVVLSWQRTWGQIEYYALPLFRKRHFPLDADRPRLQLPITAGEVVGGKPVDHAIRISHLKGDVDVHGYYFHGTSREPDLLPLFDQFGAVSALKPLYRPMDQFAGDVQWARGAWLFKGELMHRRKSNTQYQAGVGGFEYAISRPFGTVADLSLLAEYQFDNRPFSEWPVPVTNGVYSGFRLALNDSVSSDLRAGVLFDIKTSAWMIKAEYWRRMKGGLGIYVGYYGFANTARSLVLRNFERDSHLTVGFRRHL